MTALFSRPAPPVDPVLVSRALEVAGRLANDAADVISATAGRGARPGLKETPFDWVTDTGRTLERHTRRVLTSEFDIPIVCEGFGVEPPPVADGASPFRWLVDPVDGTSNYLAGLPWCAYSLALVDAHGPVVGVVADPYRAQIYAAARGRGMRANGTPVRLQGNAEARGGIVCAELTRGRFWPGMDTFTERAAAAHCAVRVLGSAALAVTQVALGHAVGAVLDDYHEWDVAGGLGLALESGAVVLNRDGEADPMPRDGLLVAAPEVAARVLDWWRAAEDGARRDPGGPSLPRQVKALP
ncbi:myo-inositol-1(or 4)-monophosphatase [Streptoalloteichus tenebrarius]|uniref:Myo-inositol-1(Or 4)-monophosphatase n=1 Tax=Streptoalloteichus tenebrarius (strain ATCC 17920 / DSM 40477 / JCM 4838 / CBS 697.72 / NBRC 16177 / NCIMB 11028 / NRRL B-12390 / A12253. 1 / ISP 5477) TaxID=1933 RepID=A0ABT1HY10_STRSD|nr:inositol monophosphatase [Streptoalloteichus tenebrarius]MCP2260413.1 myo-inositol-1(or 4)-monophosphatase [Streptoalloteichus tenebrarius]BFF02478.1 inositol monophosphatase [Streptoalloteichus tenebrarius]